MSATAQTGQQLLAAQPMLVRRGIVHRSVPVPDLSHLETTTIQVTMAGKHVLILAAYLSPSHPLIGADLTACFVGALPVLMAGDLNAKYVDWNSRLNTRRGKPLSDYANDNLRLIFEPNSQAPTHTTARLLTMS